MDQNDSPVTPFQTDPTPVVTPAGRPPDDDAANATPNFIFAVIGGSLAALAMAILWALVTVATETQYGIVAIVVGLVTGSAVRYFGRGETSKYGVLGAFLSMAGCVVGNILSLYGFIAKAQSLSIPQALLQIDFARVVGAFPETFSAMDLVFYGIAVYEGYRFSFVLPGQGGRAEAPLFGPLMRPALARFRKPLLVFGGLLVLGGIYGLRHLASGPATYTYESGATQASGEMRSGKPHGLWRTFYENGGIQSELHYRDGELEGEASWWSAGGKLTRQGAFWQGLEHGEWKNYDDNGTIVASGRFAYGRQVGEWEFRHPNRQTSLVCRYALGALDGESVSWHDNGQMSAQGRYQNDKKTGVWRTWDSGGLPLCEYRYEGDKEFVLNSWAADHAQAVKDGNGEYVSYHPDGLIKEKGQVKDGRKTGIWYAYHPNGQLGEKSRWEGETLLVIDAWNDKGVQLVRDGDGTYIVTDDAGKMLAKGDYRNGLQDGEWSSYYPDSGALMHVLGYAGGLLEGQATGYFESGDKEWEGVFKKNEREGEWIWYHDNGAVSSRVRLVAGKKDGQQIFFSSQGKKVREETYKDGKLVAERDLK
jgi:antitoxin component YwqK of YwqJK toxin-antitoxin module